MKKKNRTECDISDVFVIIFEEKSKVKKKEKTNHMICSLPYRKKKEKKAD